METPSLLKGALYPSSMRSRCPMWHPCLVSKKCQNYNQECVACTFCESAIRPNNHLGGYIAEGEYAPDLQHSLRLLEIATKSPWSHPDAKTQKTSPADISDEWEKIRKAADKMAEFSTISKMEMEEKVEETYLLGKKSGGTEVLGRLE